MRMGSYFVEIYATKILPVFLYIPHHRRSGFWKCLSRHVWAENPLFFQGKKLLPDVGIFRKISRIRKQPGFDVLFLLCLCVCVFFFFAFIRMAGIVRGSVGGACINNFTFFVCFFLRARAELFGTRPSIKQKKNCAYPNLFFSLKKKAVHCPRWSSTQDRIVFALPPFRGKPCCPPPPAFHFQYTNRIQWNPPKGRSIPNEVEENCHQCCESIFFSLSFLLKLDNYHPHQLTLIQ